MEDLATISPTPYSLQFRGRIKAVSSRVLDVRATASSQVLVTVVDEEGVTGSFETSDGAEALLLARVTLACDGSGSFDEMGTIAFGRGHVLQFRTIGAGRLLASPDAHLQHGTVMWEVSGGEGRFEGAHGRITSNFFISDTGEVTDNQLGLIFVSPSAPSQRSANDTTINGTAGRQRRNRT